MNTVIWAAMSGEVDTMAQSLALTEQGRVLIESVFQDLPAGTQQEYGSAKRVLATLLAARMSLALKSAQVTAEQVVRNGEHRVTIELRRSESDLRTIELTFRQAPAGWQVVVPDSVVERSVAVLRF